MSLIATNEPVKGYAPGSPERDEVLEQYRSYFNGKADIPHVYRRSGSADGEYGLTLPRPTTTNMWWANTIKLRKNK